MMPLHEYNIIAGHNSVFFQFVKWQNSGTGKVTPQKFKLNLCNVVISFV